MNHLRWMGHSTTIMEIQRSLRYDTDSCEVTLATKEQTIKAHRFILASCSDFLRTALADLPLGEPCTLIIPDMNGQLLESVISFIYMGETSLGSAQLTEFLEAISILGIKSAISFEYSTCNMDQTSETTNSNLEESLKGLTDVQMAQVDIIEEDADEQQKMTTTVTTDTGTETRSLEFYDVYTEPQSKIGYAIEHLPTTAANQFIITESSGTYTLTPANKLDASNVTSDNNIEEMENDEIDSQLIEEEYSAANNEPVIEVADNHESDGGHTTVSALPIIEVNHKIKINKIKTAGTLQSSTDHVIVNTTTGETLSSELAGTSMPEMEIKHMGEAYAAVNELKLMQSDDNLDLAVQAVLNEGLSLAKAANKYDVSKTVLWRRVRKNPNYMKITRENPVFTEAYSRLSRGESLKQISKELDIPMSTLHRHKVRLSQEGRLPKYVSVRKRESISKEELKERLARAVNACVHEGMSQNQAANIFDIPKSTLWRHLQRRVAEAEMQLGPEAEMQLGHETEMQIGSIKDEVVLS